jgi:hypothetical protein
MPDMLGALEETPSSDILVLTNPSATPAPGLLTKGLSFPAIFAHLLTHRIASVKPIFLSISRRYFNMLMNFMIYSRVQY